MRRIIGWLALFLFFSICILPYLIPLPRQTTVTPEQLADSGRFVTVNGYRTYVEEAGRQGYPAVVLLHGFGGSSADWHANLPALAEAGYHAIAIDLKGFGLSDKRFDEDFTHIAQAQFVAGVLDALNISHAVMVGHSMGGSVAAHFQLLYPERTDALVFVDGGAFHLEGQGRSTGLANLLNFPPFSRWARHVLSRVFTVEEAIARLRTAYADRSFLTDERAAIHMRWRQIEDWDAAYLGLIRDSSDNGLPRWTDGESVPILVMWGAQDRWIRLRTGEWYAGRLAGAEMVVIEGAGHRPMEEKPILFNQALIEFANTLLIAESR